MNIVSIAMGIAGATAFWWIIGTVIVKFYDVSMVRKSEKKPLPAYSTTHLRTRLDRSYIIEKSFPNTIGELDNIVFSCTTARSYAVVEKLNQLHLIIPECRPQWNASLIDSLRRHISADKFVAIHKEKMDAEL